jgi:hypothetical protein
MQRFAFSSPAGLRMPRIYATARDESQGLLTQRVSLSDCLQASAVEHFSTGSQGSLGRF